MHYPQWLEEWWNRYACEQLGIRSLEERLPQIEYWIQQLSDHFTTDRPEKFKEYFQSKQNLIAYGLFFYPQNFMRVRYPLQELFRRGWKTRDRYRVLDLASGTGASALGATDFLQGKVDGLATDYSASGLRFFDRLYSDIRLNLPNSSWRTREISLHKPGSIPEGPWDLILLSFGINEAFAGWDSDQIARWIKNAMGQLAPDGIFVLLEPALKETSRRLERLRAEIIEGRKFWLWGPCLHQKACPLAMDPQQWCHEVRSWTVPRDLSSMNRHLYRSIEVLKFSYLSLGMQPPDPIAPGPERFRLISPVLKSKGRYFFSGCATDGNRYDYEILTRDLSEEDAGWIKNLERGMDLQARVLDKKGDLFRIGPGALSRLY